MAIVEKMQAAFYQAEANGLEPLKYLVSADLHRQIVERVAGEHPFDDEEAVRDTFLGVPLELHEADGWRLEVHPGHA